MTSIGVARAWKPVRTADGSWTLAHPTHGETCHSLAGAWTQARERYASVLARTSPRSEGLRLLDIGTGLGLNLAAAFEACEARGVTLDAVSLELSADVIRTALDLARREPDLARDRWHAPVLAALERTLAGPDPALVGGSAVPFGPGDRHRLRVLIGDARTTLPDLDSGARFDAVFLDPFSPRVEGDLWQEPFLAEVARRMDAGAWLTTYSSSLRVRLALVRAGLAVGRGPRVGAKSSGTLASKGDGGGGPPPLDTRTAKRLARRGASPR